MNTPEIEALRVFRSQVYRSFGCRRDALFEIMEAVLSTPVIESPAHLSLAPGFQRHWGSIYDALNAGTMHLIQLAELITAYRLATESEWYAVDASVWPRCDGETSPERGYYHHHTRQSHGQPIVAGWNYSWLVQVPERCSSWTAPMCVRRMVPGENPNQVAAEQVRALLRHRSQHSGLVPIVSFDAGYDPVQLGVALAHTPICLLVRLRGGRCFYAAPSAAPTGGRPRRHGSKLVCDDPATWPEPTAVWAHTEAGYGAVSVLAWSGLHAIPQNHATRGTRQARPIVAGTLIRLEVEHLPRPTKAPLPLWLWWWGPVAPNLETIWRVYIARFAVEHLFRFFKQTLKWTLPKLRDPAAADRWTWLLILAYLQLRLAQSLVQDIRLPWQPALPVERLTPARVRRAFSSLRPQLGSPAGVPKPCGTSPGRPKGARSPPAKRIPAVKLTP
jgi:hypothetical protein